MMMMLPMQWFLGSLPPKRHLDRSAVFARLTVVTNAQTDRPH